MEETRTHGWAVTHHPAGLCQAALNSIHGHSHQLACVWGWGSAASSCVRVIITCVGLMPSDGQSKHGQRVGCGTRVPLLPGGFRSMVVFGIRLTRFCEKNTSYPVGQSKLLPLGENPFSHKGATPEKASLETSWPGCCCVWLLLRACGEGNGKKGWWRRRDYV